MVLGAGKGRRKALLSPAQRHHDRFTLTLWNRAEAATGVTYLVRGASRLRFFATAATALPHLCRGSENIHCMNHHAAATAATKSATRQSIFASP
jgi:hypothetical protein